MYIIDGKIIRVMEDLVYAHGSHMGHSSLYFIFGYTCTTYFLAFSFSFNHYVSCGGYLPRTLTSVIQPDLVFGPFLFPLISLCLAIIIFEASLNLSFKNIKGQQKNIIPFICGNSFGGFILNSLAFYFIMDMEATYAIILGAILIITGPYRYYTDSTAYQAQKVN